MNRIALLWFSISFMTCLRRFLEVTAIARACQERAHVEREHRSVGQHLGHLVLGDLTGQPLGDGRLAHAWVADEQRVVLLPSAQDLDGPLDLRFPPDERIDTPVLRLLVEVDAISLQCAVLLFRLARFLRILGVAPLVVIAAPRRLVCRLTDRDAWQCHARCSSPHRSGSCPAPAGNMPHGSPVRRRSPPARWRR